MAVFRLLRPWPRGCADQPGSASLPRTFYHTRVSLRCRLLPAALTSYVLSCLGHGSETSQTFRAASASTVRGPKSAPCLAQERPCLLGGTGPLRQTRGLSPPELPGWLPFVPQPGCLTTGLGPPSPRGSGQLQLPCACAGLVVSPAHTYTHTCTCAHTQTHTRSSIPFEGLCPLSTPRISHFLRLLITSPSLVLMMVMREIYTL